MNYKSLYTPLVLLLFSFVLIASFIIIDSVIFSAQTKKISLDVAQRKSLEREQFLEAFFHEANDTLRSVGKSTIFQNYLKSGKSELFKELLLAVVAANDTTVQFRYIDASGMEKIDIQQDGLHSSYIVENSALANRASSNYFRTARNEKFGEVWFSDIYLNTKDSKIELPYQPMIKAVLPVEKNGRFAGILVIDYLIEKVLDDFAKTGIFDIILIDKQANILRHYDNTKSWGLYTKNPYSITEEMPCVKKALTQERFQSESFFAKRLSLPVQSELYLIMKVKPAYLQEQFSIQSERLAVVSGITLMFVLMLGFIFRRYINQLLENLSQTQSMHDEMNKEKEQQEALLVQQSKMAEMGEMISAIAHQWKQPLNTLSLLMEDLSMTYEDNELTPGYIDTLTQKVHSQVAFMDQTINDFREFVKPQKQMRDFDAVHAISKITRMFKGSFEKKNITIAMEGETALILKGIENEFAQAILSIINNARDVLLEKSVDNATITCSFEKKRGTNLIRIRDNGGGIVPELLPEKLFESYISTKGNKGSGIGLHIAKMVIEKRMEGRLCAHNNKEGAEFVIEVP